MRPSRWRRSRHAVEVDGWVFLTGQIPNVPGDDAAPLPEGIEAQTRRTMDNLILVLSGLGLGLQHVVRCARLSHPVRGGLCTDERGVSRLFSRQTGCPRVPALASPG